MIVRFTIENVNIRRNPDNGHYLVDAVMHHADEIQDVTLKFNTEKDALDMINFIQSNEDNYY